MTATRIKRSDFRTFLYTGAAYYLIGDGVTSGKVQYNPKVTNEIYISANNAEISVDGYAPTFPVNATAKYGDAVFNYIDGLRQARDILGDAETYIVNVWAYETPALSNYYAEKQAVSIQVDDFGGDGGVVTKLNYTINFVDSPISGSFNPTSKVFTPAPILAGLSALTVGALTLTPLFATDKNWLWYAAATTSSPQTVSATSVDGGATVSIYNGITLVNTGTGSASGSASLSAGANTITIVIVSGTETVTYTIVVTKS